MSPKSKEELRRFEQKMHDKGSDGFADGPRPWEHWDESGNQANSRVWEGSARRIYGSRSAHGLGHRLLSLLAFLALATLLVGIGGVYYTHTQTQQIAQEDIRIQPLPTIDRTRSVSPAAEPVAGSKIIRDVDELNVLTAPAAGSGSASTTAMAADNEMAGVDSDVATAPPVDETAVAALAAAGTASEEPEAVSASEPTPPPADNNIDSVSIETVVTEKSVTTTVYTRQLQQDKPEVIAAIETTPPPFVHEVAPAAGTTAAADASSATVDETAMASDAASVGADIATGIEADSPAGAETVESQDMLTLTSPATDTPSGETATTASTNMTEDGATVASTGMEAGADEATALTPTAAPREAAVPAPSETQAGVDESAAAVTTRDTAVPAPSGTEADVDESAAAVAAQDTALPAPSETEADVGESAVAADAVTAQDTAAITAPTEADTDEAATAALTAPAAEPAPEETAAETPVAEQTSQIALAEPVSPVEETTPAETAQADTAVKQPIMPVARQGDWVINLASYTWKSTANKKLALFRDKGVDAEVFRVMINDKPMYRVRVTGFESSRAARAEVASIEQTLDLEGAWVARR